MSTLTINELNTIPESTQHPQKKSIFVKDTPTTKVVETLFG